MILGIPKKPQNFAEWLDAATRNLVPSAQARVRPEIEAHYAEARQAHLQKGSSETVAQIAALADLGDACAAARRFQRQYLTSNASTYFSAFARMDRCISAFCFVLFSLASVWFFVFPAAHLLPAWFWMAQLAGQLLVFASASILYHVLARQKGSTTNLEWLYTLQFLIHMFVMIALLDPVPVQDFFGAFPSLKQETFTETVITQVALWCYLLPVYWYAWVQLKVHLANKKEKLPNNSATA